MNLVADRTRWRRMTSARWRITLNARLGGALLTLCGVMILMGIITAETQYPTGQHYSTVGNEISDLGATLPPHPVITQPTAHIFDWTMVVSGACLIIAGLSLHSLHRSRMLTVAIELMGLGVLGVGVFSNTHHVIHESFSLTAFLFGALAVVRSSSVTKPPFRVLAVLLGVTSLVFLFSRHAFYGALGRGGVERWIAYPIVLWMVGYGGYVQAEVHTTAGAGEGPPAR